MKIFLRLAQAAGLLLLLTAAAAADEPLKIATSAGPVGQLASFAAKLAKEKGQDVKIVELSDWVALNEVVNSGEVDGNLFQHGTYLALQNKQRGFNLVQVDKVG
jgi:D-methionine transport system substrate-binding protein